ncbi:MAG: glycoside hydrolase TIM-barrel-like domain-containing protein [Rickettsiaceae bacterium]|nr:glycoside hydrolase TIM-barrel-like domain-containing protein [Rickettsiaceae bacterium]
MIPGSGEYVYDTKIQSKKQRNIPDFISPILINSHNDKNIADSVYSLDQLQTICQNIDWVSPVVCWFADNLDASKCLIKPAIEFRDENIEYSEAWQVGKYNRNNAYEIKKDENGNPLYGGTVNDKSVIRYLIELKNRGLKIMFYPMFFLDVDKKPWRGRVTGDPDGIYQFFNKTNGYNEFILHYANLVKDHVDAFIIGSELIGLTKIGMSGYYVAVEELIKLAALVKNIVGENVKISYAADWSEYHHTEGGWYNLDPLWSSPDIDFIGIDAYFPVTDSISSVIDFADIDHGWGKGEGYDYYIDQQTGDKKFLKPAYAWKNLRYWWENFHINPDNTKSKWIPKSKPIWFTEYGFPSIDKAPNQPNVFFDPKCFDGGIPKYSNGNIDFAIQRRAINSFIKYWQKEEYIEQMFLWTWDARPYPAWPHMNIWRDGYLWEKGHWVNNKFGNTNLAAILLEISQKSKLDISQIDTSSVDLPVEGVNFSNQISAENAINTLRAAYFFDINSYATNFISFIRRGVNNIISIDDNHCLKLNDNSYFEETDIPASLKLSQLNLYYIHNIYDYKKAYKNFYNELDSYSPSANIRLPIVLSENEAENIGNLVLANAMVENSIIKFSISCQYFSLKPCDFLELKSEQKIYKLRIINVEIQNLACEITAIIDQKELYCRDFSCTNSSEIKANLSNNNHLFIDILENDLTKDAIKLAVNYIGPLMKPLYMKLASEQNWRLITNLIPSKFIAFTEKFVQPQEANIFLIDESSYILVNTKNLILNSGLMWHEVQIGKEILAFKNIEQLDQNHYRISHLIRGLKGTHQYINNHDAYEQFSYLQQKKNLLTISNNLLNQVLYFKCGYNQAITKIKSNNDNFSIYIREQKQINNSLYIQWAHRLSNDNGWNLAHNLTYQYKVQITSAYYNQELITNQTSILIDNFHVSEPYKINIIPFIN